VPAILSSTVLGPFAGQSTAIGRSGSGESIRQNRELRGRGGWSRFGPV